MRKLQCATIGVVLSWLFAISILISLSIVVKPFSVSLVLNACASLVIIYYLGFQSLVITFISVLLKIYLVTVTNKTGIEYYLFLTCIPLLQIIFVCFTYKFIMLTIRSIMSYFNRLKFKHHHTKPQVIYLYKGLFESLTEKCKEIHKLNKLGKKDNGIFSTRFKKDKHVYIPSIISPSICRLLTSYALLSSQVQPHIESEDQQVPGTHSVYADQLMESLLLYLTPTVERYAGLSLYPTFSFYRVYKRGDILKPHHDRASCEVTATLCLGKPDNTSLCSWPLKIQRKNHQEFLYDIGVSDAVIYRGIELNHWRDPFQGEWLLQVFLHYVEQGSASRIYKYDLRENLGYAQLNALQYIIKAAWRKFTMV